ncbi:MAG: 4-(cytidine 5'-diphospho)-2-C-methyl-D-erythritol kinase [Natronospirillum sp.]
MDKSMLPALPDAHNPWRLPAPAKLNLMLHITGRRADGYHELQTLFQLLAWGDELTFSLNAETADVPPDAPVTLCDDSGIPLTDNLIVLAAQLLRPIARSFQPTTITLNKRIPMGGGLGGGSSDAATTLLALNHLWAAELSVDALAELGRQLGADVPVFVRSHSAWAEGIGDQLTPVELPQQWFVVAHPKVTINTATVFNDPGLTRNSQITTIRTALKRGGRNDCEQVVRQRYPAVDELLRIMSTLGDARLTGTGACCFLPYATELDATSVANELRSHANVFVAQGVNQSPVVSAMAALTQQCAFP